MRNRRARKVARRLSLVGATAFGKRALRLAPKPVLGVAVGVALTAAGVARATRGPDAERPAVIRVPGEPAPARDDTALRVLSLNLAHGRSTRFHQGLIRTSTIRANLDGVAAEIRRLRPDVVALQEADGPSAWSGRFDHTRYLAQATGLVYVTRASHVEGLGLSYGTALLSRLPLTDPRSATLASSRVSFSKGYVKATLNWAGEDVDLVSVHLDFASSTARERQARQLAGALSASSNPVCVLGDFNSEWWGDERTLRGLGETLGLHAYRPDDEGLVTFPLTSRRLDWILVPEALQFTRYEAIPGDLSDHWPVLADLHPRWL